MKSFFQRFNKKADDEQAQLDAGENPENKIKSPLQRMAAKLIIGFFALMLLFTIVSRAAQGMTVALVQASNPMPGTITDRTDLTGYLQPLEDQQEY